MKKTIICGLLAFAPVFAATPCTPATTGNILGDLDVPAGSVCQLADITVSGNVTVEGVLFTSGTHIKGSLLVTGLIQTLAATNPGVPPTLTAVDGDVTISNSVYVMLRDTTVKGSVSVANGNGGSSGLLQLTNVTIGKLLNISSNTQSVKVESVSTGSNAIFSDNEGGVRLIDLAVGKNLNCSDNSNLTGVNVKAGQHMNGQCSSL
jgi:hypothetical protein